MNQDEDRDVELERLARQLGSRAAGRLDVEGTAAAVVARLRTDRARQRPRWMQVGVVCCKRRRFSFHTFSYRQLWK